MKPGESEYFKLCNWIDTFLEIPFNIYKIPKYMNESINTSMLMINDSLAFPQPKCSDNVPYGHQKPIIAVLEVEIVSLEHLQGVQLAYFILKQLKNQPYVRSATILTTCSI